MIVKKGNDLILNIDDITDVVNIRIYTNNISEAIEKTEISNKLYISSDDLAKLHSGVITYDIYKSKSDTSLSDGSYDTINTVVTDIYYIDTEESGTQHKKSDTVEEYVDKKIDEFKDGIVEKISDQITDTVIENVIGTVDGKIKVETDRATNKEDKLEESIITVDSKTTANTNAISSLQATVSNKADISSIPTKTSQLTNDSGYLTEHQDLTEYAKTTDLNSEVNRAKNVENTLQSNIDKKQDTLQSGTNIKTINGNSLLGSGDITIEGGGGGSTDIPKMWVNVLSNKDTAFVIDGEIVEIPAHKNMILKDFKSIEPYVNKSEGIANTCDGLVRFDIHYNDINVPITKFTFETYININGWIMTYAKLLKHLDVSGWDTSNMTSMESMFLRMMQVTELDVSGFDTSKVTSFKNMFNECSSLTSLDVSGFDTSKATSMYCMFTNTKLTTIDVSGFDTTKVTEMHRMFLNDSSLTTLDVSGWDVSKVTDFDYMFMNCRKLTTLDTSKWNPKSIKRMLGTFYACPFTTLDVSNFELPNLYDMGGIFDNCTQLTNIIFGEGWGKTEKAISLDLSTCGSSKSYKFTDDTYNSMLTMYDRVSNGLTTTYTIKFSTKHNIPDGFVESMTAKGYTIVTA